MISRVLSGSHGGMHGLPSATRRHIRGRVAAVDACRCSGGGGRNDDREGRGMVSPMTKPAWRGDDQFRPTGEARPWSVSLPLYRCERSGTRANSDMVGVCPAVLDARQRGRAGGTTTTGGEDKIEYLCPERPKLGLTCFR